MRAKVSRKFVIDAAHSVPCIAGPEHLCGILHGHTWTIEVQVWGQVNPETGIVIDYLELASAWDPVKKALDHKNLNDVISKPTTENIAAYIWQVLAPKLQTQDRFLNRLTIQEGASDVCEFWGEF